MIKYLSKPFTGFTLLTLCKEDIESFGDIVNYLDLESIKFIYSELQYAEHYLKSLNSTPNLSNMKFKEFEKEYNEFFEEFGKQDSNSSKSSKSSLDSELENEFTDFFSDFDLELDKPNTSQIDMFKFKKFIESKAPLNNVDPNNMSIVEKNRYNILAEKYYGLDWDFPDEKNEDIKAILNLLVKGLADIGLIYEKLSNYGKQTNGISNISMRANLTSIPTIKAVIDNTQGIPKRDQSMLLRTVKVISEKINNVALDDSIEYSELVNSYITGKPNYRLLASHKAKVKEAINTMFELVQHMLDNPVMKEFYDRDLSDKLKLATILVNSTGITGFIPDPMEMLVKNIGSISSSTFNEREYNQDEVKVLRILRLNLISKMAGFSLQKGAY